MLARSAGREERTQTVTITESAQRATLKGHGAGTFVYLGHGKAARESGPIVRAAKREHGSGYVLVNAETGEEVRGAGGGSATKFWAAPVPTEEIEAETTATEDEIVEPRVDCTDPDCAQAAREGHTPEEVERAIVTALVVSGEEFSVREVHGMVPLAHIIRRGVRSLCGRTTGAAGYRLDLGLVDCLACLDQYTEETRNSVPRETCPGCGQSITAPNNLPAALRTADTRQCEACDLFDRL